MKIVILTITALTLALLMGCTKDRRGPGLPMTLPTGDAATSPTSGLPPSLTLSSLSETQLTQFCQWAVDTQGGPERTRVCGDITIRTGTVASCADGLQINTCDITVGTMEGCVRALVEDACSVLEDPACAEVVACGMATSDL